MTNEYLDDLASIRKRMSDVIQTAAADEVITPDLAAWLEARADANFDKAISWTITKIEAYQNRFADWDDKLL